MAKLRGVTRLRVRACVYGLFGFVACSGAVGCGSGAIKQVRGANFDLSGKENGIADEYEQQEPKAADAGQKCVYWQEREQNAQGSHTIGILNWPSDYFGTLRSWVTAKKDEACAAADVAKKEQEAKDAKAKDAERASAREKAQEDAEAQIKAEKARLAKMLELSDQEIQNDRCDQRRHGQLQARLHEAKEIRSPLRDSTSGLLLMSHQILPTKPDGTDLEIAATLGGEIHIMAVGYGPLRLDVYDAKGYRSALTSNFRGGWPDAPDEDILANLNQTLRSKQIKLDDTRVIHANVGDKIRIQVKGRGCTLVAAYQAF